MASGRSTIEEHMAPDVAVKGCVRPDVTRSTATTRTPTSTRPSAPSPNLVRAGKVATSALDVPGLAIVEAQWTARERVRERFVLSNALSILTAGIEVDRPATCVRSGWA